MQRLLSIIVIITLFSVPQFAFGQTEFSTAAYQQFLDTNKDLPVSELLNRHAPQAPYYSNLAGAPSPGTYSYLDSIEIKLGLTENERQILEKNHFVVSERMNYLTMGWAFHDIYIKDLPVFVTTDAVLDALHASYDRLLMHLESEILEQNLIEFLDALWDAYPQLVSKYSGNSALAIPLADVDVYLTMAKSLQMETMLQPQLTDEATIKTLWDAVKDEKSVSLPLFSERVRDLDFSQFTIRGHYTHEFWDGNQNRTLGAYFQTMMWLGRMDFMLTPPPVNPWDKPWTKEEIRRMNLGAFLLNELIELSNARHLMNENNEMIEFLVGESDNLTPTEFDEILQELMITDAGDLLNDTIYDALQEKLYTSQNAGQKILSNIIRMDPYSSVPDTLPVSYRVMGQRFIIDSYVFYSLVYPNIIYGSEKIWRPMPDPLDAMFVLGNDNAAPLLKEELDQYHYASQAAGLRYLVESYDDDFWDATLYNVWLNGIRALNPQTENDNLPVFMHSVAWQQQKLNTQLASWTQLRHDNLLYAKQSYTGATGCSFPHSYIEPYPEFYRRIAQFAAKGDAYFSQIQTTSYLVEQIKAYFPRLKVVMERVAELAEKEVNQEMFNEDDIAYLQSMLFDGGMSGEPPFSGWYTDLFYDPWIAVESDFLVADVHTQPTDRAGNPVGKVLHVGVGKINLGIFLAESPADNYSPVAFVGPVMSYYEKITNDFDRLTDERWNDFVEQNTLPERPDWVNIYLADAQGNSRQPGRELSGTQYTGIDNPEKYSVDKFLVVQNYPNPFNPVTTISYSIPEQANVRIAIFDILGQQVANLLDEEKSAGSYKMQWQANGLPSGLYFCRIQAGVNQATLKLVLMK